jgi:hypothetical protein
MIAAGGCQWVRLFLNAPFLDHEEGISFLPIPTIIAIPLNNAIKTCFPT